MAVERIQPRRAREAVNPLIVAWAAGFFDGEGCVYAGEGVQKGGYRRFTFTVSAGQVVRDPLEVLEEHWGGTIHPIQSRGYGSRPQWLWMVRGQAAARFLEDVLPFLRVKATVARAALPGLLNTHRHGVNLSPDEIAMRRAAVSEVRSLNRPRKEVA